MNSSRSIGVDPEHSLVSVLELGHSPFPNLLYIWSVDMTRVLSSSRGGRNCRKVEGEFLKNLGVRTLHLQPQRRKKKSRLLVSKLCQNETSFSPGVLKGQHQSSSWRILYHVTV